MVHPTKNKSLEGKIIWHLKVVASSLILSFLFGAVIQKKLFHEQFISLFIFLILQLELFIWIGTNFFESIKPDQPNFKRRITVRLILFYISVLSIALVLFFGMYLFQYISNGADFSNFFDNLLKLEMKGFLIATLIGFAFGAIIFFYTQWNEALNRVQKLKEEKLIFQYETLKSQVNPHFLFNSLNSLSSLVKTDPDLSEEFVLKLSSVYRYILENNEKELIPLSKELEFVNNYFDLQKIRDGEKIRLRVEINSDEELEILPVSLQLLVENAIKHNSASRKNPLEIIIHNDGIDRLVVRNKKQLKMQIKDSSRIGLKNLNERCRLTLGREIEIVDNMAEFIVKIPVKIV